MRLLGSTDLALRVLMRLSTEPDQHVSTDVPARELVVSRHHLHKIVQYLTEITRLRGMLAAAEDAFYQHLDRYTLANCLAATGLSAHERASRKRPRRCGATAPQRRSIRLELAERRG